MRWRSTASHQRLWIACAFALLVHLPLLCLDAPESTPELRPAPRTITRVVLPPKVARHYEPDPMPVPASRRPQPAPVPRRRARRQAPAVAPEQVPTPRATPAPVQVAAPAPAPAATPAPKPIDLFAAEALRSVAAARLPEVTPEIVAERPPDPTPTPTPATISDRLLRYHASVEAEQAVRGGRVDRWFFTFRDALEDHYQPDWKDFDEDVAEGGPLAAAGEFTSEWMRDWVRKAKQYGRSGQVDGGGYGVELMAVVRVVQSLSGEVQAVQLMEPSGRDDFDRFATDAVTQAAQKTEAPERVGVGFGLRGDRIVSVWAFKSSFGVLPPTALGCAFDLGPPPSFGPCVHPLMKVHKNVVELRAVY